MNDQTEEAVETDPKATAVESIKSILEAIPGEARALVASLGDVVDEVERDAMRSMMASALSHAIDTAPKEWTPPASWFQPPEGPGGDLISQEGRVSGYVATWEDVDGAPMCHAGYAAEGSCEPVPRGGSYDYFHQGNVSLTLDDGTKIHPGLLTTDVGHGNASGSVESQIAHYDNPEAIAAAVVVGEDDTGIWMAGSVLPQVMEDPQKFTRLRLTPVSGHWSVTRPGGPMELVAVTAVNKPGFPQRSTSGYELAASFGGGAAGGLLEQLAGQLEAASGTLRSIVASSAQASEEDYVPGQGVEDEEVEPEHDYPEEVDRELVDAALQALREKSVQAASVPPGVELPRCLTILADYLEGMGEDAHHARAASVKAAQDICRSDKVQNAAVRMRACRLVSEYRARNES